MRRTMIMMSLVLALVAGACAADVTESTEYQDLEAEVAALQQELSGVRVDLASAQADLVAAQAWLDEGETSSEAVPDEVLAVLDEFEAALERKDGSIVDLYLPTGYHMYGTQKITRDNLESHLGAAGWTHEWITQPFLVVAEPEGRYVVTRGLRNSSGLISAASAFTFEIVTRGGELKIAETGWTDVTSTQ